MQIYFLFDSLISPDFLSELTSLSFSVFKFSNADFVNCSLAKEQFTKSALENLKTENERLVNSLKKSGEIKESKRK